MSLKVKNIAIISHVDHGKTTLVDCLLRFSGTLRDTSDRLLDSNDLEKEKGMTILSKVASVSYKDYKINIVDTPGHADFGGEVERIMNMVDGVFLLVDAAEGPMPQTKFLLSKVLEYGFRPIVVINKIDKRDAMPDIVAGQVFDLFYNLGANAKQLDFPLLYASARHGYAIEELSDERKDFAPFFEAALKYISEPKGSNANPLQVQVSLIDYDDYLGRLGIGRVVNGEIRTNDSVLAVYPDGKKENAKIMKLYGFVGNKRVPIDYAGSGDIVAVSGISNIDVGVTLTDKEHPAPLPPLHIDEPTMSAIFSVNDSPFAGKEGKFVTVSKLKERLIRESRSNVSIIYREAGTGRFEIVARGELQLAIIMEEMRREGYEFSVSAPKVVFKYENGKKLEPILSFTAEVAPIYVGAVIEKLSRRRASIDSIDQLSNDLSRISGTVPTRGSLGYHQQFLTDTHGEGVISFTFKEYGEYRGEIKAKKFNSLSSFETGKVTAYALNNLSKRGEFYVAPGDDVYGGQVVGFTSLDHDMDINVCKKKNLTNMRAAAADKAVVIKPPVRISLEKAIELVTDDQLIEITPKSVRLHFRLLNANERKKHSRGQEWRGQTVRS